MFVSKTRCKRPDWNETCIGIIRVLAERVTCIYVKVACLFLTSENNIAAVGYNGPPRGVIHCCEVGCAKDDDGACRGAHAEINAIINCVGAPRHILDGSTLYITILPCNQCMKQLTQVGIVRIVFIDYYTRYDGNNSTKPKSSKGKADIPDDSRESLDQARAAKIVVEQYNLNTKETHRIV